MSRHHRGPSLASALPRRTVLISFLRLTASVLWAGIATEDSPAGEDVGWGSGFVFLTIPGASGCHLFVTTQVATGHELSLPTAHIVIYTKQQDSPMPLQRCFQGGVRACRYGPVPGQNFPFCSALLKWVYKLLTLVFESGLLL